MFRTMHAMAAYGRTVNRNDWEDGLDFFSLDHGQYFSKRDTLTLTRDGIIKIFFIDNRTFEPVFSITL